MRKKRLIRLLAMMLCAVMTFSFAACKKTEETAVDSDRFYIYYKDSAKRELYPVEGVLDPSLERDVIVSSLWHHMQTSEDQTDYTSAIPNTIELKNYVVEDTNLIMSFGASYYDLNDRAEILMRAAVVKTFTQLPDFSTVEFRVDDQPFTLADGKIVGPMKGTDFVDVIGDGINTYSKADITLYFANQDGDALIRRNYQVTYNNSYPVEQYILYKLIQGPGEEEGCYSTIPEGVSVLSVSTQNGICYVNLSGDFVKETLNVIPEISIYSIVDSLTELSGITGVQISVDGSSTMMFMDKIDLSQPIKRDLDYIMTEPEETVQE